MSDSEDIAELIQLEVSENKVPATQVPVTMGGRLKTGIPLVAGFLTMRELYGRFTIPYYSPITHKGYQRPPQRSRVNALAKLLSAGGVDLPNAILMNIRAPGAANYAQGGLLHLPAFDASHGDAFKLYIVDGQHRVLAIRKAIADGWRGGLDFMIPFVCMLGADEQIEMTQFYEVNSNAKSVRTDLALALLKERSTHDPSVMEKLIAKGTAWQIAAQAIVERLAVESQVWKGLIKLPTMAGGATVMPSASMVKSLGSVLTSPYIQRLTEDQRITVLDAYWMGVKRVFPEAFAEPEKYVLLKGVGVRVLHNIMPLIVEQVRDDKKSVADPESYVELLEYTVLDLSAPNPEGDTVEGKDFWLSGSKGAAGSFSSESGIKRLSNLLIQKLPTHLF